MSPALQLHPAPAPGPRVPAILTLAKPGGGDPPLTDGTAGEPDDLPVLRPTRAELSAKGKLARIASEALANSGASELLYLLPPLGWRRRARQQLERAGWSVGPPIAHLSRKGVTRATVTLSGGVSLASELSAALPAPVRSAMRALDQSPLRGWLTEAWPQVGLVAWRPASRGCYAWLADALGTPAPPDAIVSVQGWRGADDTALLYYRHPTFGATGVVKVARHGASTSAEADALEVLGPSARNAGALVPELIQRAWPGGRPAAILSRVPGSPAWIQVRRRRRRLHSVLSQVADWLLTWNLATVRRAPLTGAHLEALVLEPANRLLEDGTVSSSYLARLRALCEAALDRDCPWVAAHNDLTLFNILVAGDSISVVDWEAAVPESLPLMDLEYLAVDAVLAASGGSDRASSWSDCFADAGAHRHHVGRLRERAIASLRIAAPVAAVCRHACWLMHACNEQEHSRPGAPRPFLETLHRLEADLLEAEHD